jgi:integrase/recombinase XerD
MKNYETKEPEYIEESEEIITLKKYYTPESLNIQKGHWSLGFTLLTHTLFLMYNNTMFSELVNKSQNHEESIKFSTCMKKVAEINEWAYSTTNIALNSLKKLLTKTNINSSFISKISISYDKNIKKNSPEFCLPTTYKKLDDDNKEKQTLISLIKIIKSDTKYKSQHSIRMFVAYIIKFLKYHNISICDYQNIQTKSFNEIKESISNIYTNKSLRIKIYYTMIFICFIVKYTENMKDFEIYKKSVHLIKKPKEDHDTHRITKTELEKMYEASKTDIKKQTIFLLMISTGMRTIGVSNIKLDHICTMINNVLTINKTGRTLEKGNKWFTFPISENLSKLLVQYITNKRKSNSSYLFPGRGEDIGISPSRISAIIKQISKDAGLTGLHIHAHSLRHSFAHILLESGNKAELVSKMLGHTSTLTTEYYYLKESAAEASKRMNIPWLERTEQENPVPSFLNTNKHIPETKKRKTKTERNIMLKSLVKDFKGINNLKKIEE